MAGPDPPCMVVLINPCNPTGTWRHSPHTCQANPPQHLRKRARREHRSKHGAARLLHIISAWAARAARVPCVGTAARGVAIKCDTSAGSGDAGCRGAAQPGGAAAGQRHLRRGGRLAGGGQHLRALHIQRRAARGRARGARHQPLQLLEGVQAHRITAHTQERLVHNACDCNTPGAAGRNVSRGACCNWCAPAAATETVAQLHGRRTA
jgi:hypothetical protein